MKQLLVLLVCWKYLNYSSWFILNPNLIKCFLCAYTAHDICLVSRVKACFRQASKDEWINVQLPSRLIQYMQNLIYIYHIFVTQESKIYATSPQNNENSILLSKISSLYLIFIEKLRIRPIVLHILSGKIFSFFPLWAW